MQDKQSLYDSMDEVIGSVRVIDKDGPTINISIFDSDDTEKVAFDLDKRVLAQKKTETALMNRFKKVLQLADFDTLDESVLRIRINDVFGLYMVNEESKPEPDPQKQIEETIKETLSNPMTIAAKIQTMNPIWFDQSRNIWMWDKAEKKYSMIDETDVLCGIDGAINVDGIYKSKVKSEIMECIRMTGRKRNVKDTCPEWIQFQDTVVDIKLNKLFEPTHSYFFASPIPHNHGKDCETPTIDKLFTDWVGEEHKQVLYEICSYCLYDHYPIHRIFAFIGTGRNGKGQFMTLLKRLIGEENALSTDLDRISNSRFETANFYKKKVAFIGETNFNTLNRTNTLKMLSGGDVVPGEYKGKGLFHFVNTAKIIIATNSLPDTGDRTDGFYRRWLIIDFCNKFEEGRDVINEIPEWEYENLCHKCTKLLTELLERGKFHKEGTVEERAARYEAKSNPLNKFIEDSCIQDENEKIPYWYLYDRYIEHCNNAGYRKVTKKEFTNMLKNIGFETKQSKFNIELVKIYKNIENDYEVEPSNWMAVLGIGWNWGRRGRRSKGNSTLFPPMRNRSENTSTSSTSSTSESLIEKISDAASRFEKEHGPITKNNLVDGSHTIANWTKTTPSEVRSILEKLCKLSSILDEDNAESI